MEKHHAKRVTFLTTGFEGQMISPLRQAKKNGAMMRISPLGIFGANHDAQHVVEWARQDAAITHDFPRKRSRND